MQAACWRVPLRSGLTSGGLLRSSMRPLSTYPRVSVVNPRCSSSFVGGGVAFLGAQRLSASAALINSRRPVQAQTRWIRVSKKGTTTATAERTTTYDDQLVSDQAAALAAQQRAQDVARGPTAGSVLEADLGMQKFLSRVVGHLGAGLSISALSATAFVTGALPMPTFGVMMGVGLVGGIGCLFAISSMRPTTIRDAQGHLTSQNSPLRLGLAATFAVFQGMMMAPLLAMSPASLVTAAGLCTAGVVAGMSAFALSRPTGSMLRWGAPLFAGVLGLIGCSLGAMLLGPGSGVGSALFWLSSIGGVGIFSAFVAYDVQMAISEYQQGNSDHLGHAVNLFLDFINLFKNILILLRYFDD
eukprot:NODE_1691_length_1440_cov_31.093458_g1526_i0.p1 GENE.NODE_1691_length_1440_cov_31.093458_g1526_i0~~NODE_1691_length_1440_cov_31.093458_g1526_i0.p1  ORF type:complete len:357 (+),score=60.52 NODE_1691_length_1440_cov_31.093458_g1526_i0:109-1179(+)